LTRDDISNVHVREANVLELDKLPPSWTNYDLIVSVAMLEYLPRADLVTGLTSLRTRLARHGWLLLFITRKNWITKLLIERWTSLTPHLTVASISSLRLILAFLFKESLLPSTE